MIKVISNSDSLSTWYLDPGIPFGDGTQETPYYWDAVCDEDRTGISGTVSSSSHQYYKILLKSGITYTFRYNKDGSWDGDMRISFYDSDGTAVKDSWDSDPIEQFDYTPTKDGLCTLRIQPYSSYSGSFKYLVTPAPEQFIGNPGWKKKEGLAQGDGWNKKTGKVFEYRTLEKAAIKYNDIPKYTAPLELTGNINSDWEVSASSIYDSSFDAYRAFDGLYSENNSGWFSGSGQPAPQWLQWKNLKEKVNIKTYLLQFGFDGSNRYFKSWELQGSDNGTDWVKLDEVTNFTTSSNGYLFKREINNNKSFYYHRLYITDVTNGYISVGEFKCWNGIFKDIWKDIICYYPLIDDETDLFKIIKKNTSRNITKTGDGYLFNGSDSYINLGRQMFESVNDQITLAGWIKPNSLTKDQILISKTEGGDWEIAINESSFNNYVCGYLRLNGTYYNPKFNVNDLNLNEWNHLALTYDGSSIKLYHNGVVKDTVNASGTISHSSAPCMIGAEPNNSGYAGSSFDGLIKNVGVWARGLTENEIKKLAVK